MRAPWLVSSALLVALAGCTATPLAGGLEVSPAGPLPAPRANMPASGLVTGIVAVPMDRTADTAPRHVGSTCHVSPSFNDQHEGAPVAILDEAGSTLALGVLHDDGVRAPGGDAQLAHAWCQFSFVISGVPKGHGVYVVVSGDHEPFRVAEDQLFGSPSLTLGDVGAG